MTEQIAVVSEQKSYSDIVSKHVMEDIKKKGFNITLLNTRASTRREQEVILRDLQAYHGFDLTPYKIPDKRRLLANCVKCELGLHILNESKKNIQPELFNSAIQELREKIKCVE